jgi:hypothetical protein
MIADIKKANPDILTSTAAVEWLTRASAKPIANARANILATSTKL